MHATRATIDPTALWKDIRFTSERHLRYVVAEGKKNNSDDNRGAPRFFFLMFFTFKSLKLPKKKLFSEESKIATCTG